MFFPQPFCFSDGLKNARRCPPCCAFFLAFGHFLLKKPSRKPNVTTPLMPSETLESLCCSMQTVTPPPFSLRKPKRWPCWPGR
ncbi:hypothetical protein CGZ77_07925 [Neisseria sp. KEM232]|nr:hypothetical protein CGZ77_07925 [Neisseria sp. KEM232]